MSDLKIELLEYIQHLQSVKVRFTYEDIANAFAEMILPLPTYGTGAVKSGEDFLSSLSEQAPDRDWFEKQEKHLNGTHTTAITLPPELQAIAPIKALNRPLEWFEDSYVSEPEFVDGKWVRAVKVIDLRDTENLEDLKVRLKAKLATIRYEVEVSGVTVLGSLVQTDRESQATIGNAFTKAVNDSTSTVSWKAIDGFVQLDSESIITVGNAVFNHVQGCFEKEGHFSTAIDASSTISELLEIADEIEQDWRV